MSELCVKSTLKEIPFRRLIIATIQPEYNREKERERQRERERGTAIA